MDDYSATVRTNMF